jgi:hypothetical protein
MMFASLAASVKRAIPAVTAGACLLTLLVFVLLS